MESVRAGFGSRLGSIILDTFFVALISAGVLALTAAVGGVNLAIEIQRQFGISASVSTVTSQSSWDAIASRAESVGKSVQAEWERDFSSEQIEFIGGKIGNQFAEFFAPGSVDATAHASTLQAPSSVHWTNYVVRAFSVNSATIPGLVHQGFDAVRASGRSDIDPAKLTAAETELQQLLTQFHVAEIVPKAIGFALLLLIVPFAVLILYLLAEAFSGSTPGKKVGHLVVLNADGSKAGIGMLFSRFIIKNIWALLLIVGLGTRSSTVLLIAGLSALAVFVGCFGALGSERRSLHDYIAGTAVYYR